MAGSAIRWAQKRTHDLAYVLGEGASVGRSRMLQDSAAVAPIVLINALLVVGLYLATTLRGAVVHWPAFFIVAPSLAALPVAIAFVLLSLRDHERPITVATFVTGLLGTVVAAPLGERLARHNGVYIFPVPLSTELRVAFGTAALLATASVLALSVGAIVRHGAGAVTAVILAIVLPYILTAIPFMPASAANWLTRVTPAAAFAVQQTLVEYHQVAGHYTPYNGYYPLAPWAGFAVLAAYAVASLAAAAVLLGRRDA